MLINSLSNYIKCYFEVDAGKESKSEPTELDVFFTETKNLNSLYSDLKKYITNDEQSRADKFHFNSDRETYISCHALLRLILSKRMNISPLNISFIKEINNKPALKGNPLFFNIAHTREAFAIAINRDFHLGIDLEKIDQRIDIQAIIKTYFSKKERDFIHKSDNGTRDRFFLLWTRKEALLKALGTGIINNLTQVEVSEHRNCINKKSIDNLVADSVLDAHFIYSKKLLNYYLSIAIPHKAIIYLYHLNDENIATYLD